MSSDNIAISVKGLSKSYHIYGTPGDRLKQFVLPCLQRIMGRRQKKYFQEFDALKNISFEIKRGETVGIIGLNGSGKSTLLQLICGTLHPTAGHVEINGRLAALLELGSGFNPEFTGRENIYLNASVLGLSIEEVDERFDDISAFADIGKFIEQPIKTYSSGMVVRLAFAVIAHVDADILVIDEALSVGDAFFVQKCMRFLRQFMKMGTVLFVSHDTGAVLNLCQTAMLLENGIVVAQGKPKKVTEQYLEKLYECQQGNENIPIEQIEDFTEDKENIARDVRLDFINQTSLRNDIELFPFTSEASSFGKGGAKVLNVQLLDKNGKKLAWVVGGEQVIFVIRCVAKDELSGVIIGFQVKDRLGQVVFADNTYLSCLKNPVTITGGERFRASFAFVMPIMPVGDYTISVAVAEGTQNNHLQHHWIHDALSFKVHSSYVCHGLIGVPMNKIGVSIE